MSPLVSVVIPAYNCANYIGEAIESVWQQTFIDYEIVIVNDGSKDDSDKVIKQYFSQEIGAKINYVYQENQGVSVARNHGIELAQGEFIAFLDADDYFLPDKLAAQLNVFQNKPELGLVHSGWRRVNDQGEPLQDITPWTYCPNLDLESWLKWKPVLPSAMILRREWLEKAGGFDPLLPPAEDTDLCLRLAFMGCAAEWLKKITVCYRQHPESAMFKGLPQAKSLAQTIDKFFANPELPANIRLLENQIKYNTYVWIGWYLHSTGHPVEMKEFLQKSWPYSPYIPVENIINWVESFASYSESALTELDVDLLAKSAEWQDLMVWVINHH